MTTITLPSHITEEDVYSKAVELYEGEYSPYTPENFSEAVGDIPASLEARVSALLAAKDDAEVGRLLRTHAENYWWGHAKNAAPGVIMDDIKRAEFDRAASESDYRRVA